jgi:ribosomal protein S18 acetylase RimI-like enzyme
MYFIDKLIKNGIDPETIYLSVSSRINLIGIMGEAEPDDTIILYDIAIELEKHENDKEISGRYAVETVGEARVLSLPGFLKDGMEVNNLLDVADSYSGDLLMAVELIVNEDGCLEMDGGTLDSDIAFIEEFKIKPEYQNKGIGSAVMYLLLNSYFNSAGAFVVIPSGERIINAQSAVNMRKILLKQGFYCIDTDNDIWVKNTSL